MSLWKNFWILTFNSFFRSPLKQVNRNSADIFAQSGKQKSGVNMILQIPVLKLGMFALSAKNKLGVSWIRENIKYFG